jgi:hypothetical protein
MRDTIHFKFLSNPKLLCLQNGGGPDEYLKGINRDATDPLELLSVSRINNEMLLTGSLFILKSYYQVVFSGLIEVHNLKA